MQGLEKLKELADKLPAELKKNALDLIERMEQTIEGIGDKPIEWRPGNLKVVQATTDRSKLPKGAGIGAMLVGEAIQEQPLKVIPLSIWTTRQKWSPDRDNTKLECWSPDGKVGFTLGLECAKCPHQVFDKIANKADCNKSKTALTVTQDLTTIFTTTFSKTSYQNGVAFEDLMKKAGVAPFKRVYSMKTGSHSKYKNVEAITVETENKETLAPPVVDFLQELYNVMAADRKSTLAMIHDLVKARAANATTALPSATAVEVLPAMEDASEGTPASSQPRYSL